MTIGGQHPVTPGRVGVLMILQNTIINGRKYDWQTPLILYLCDPFIWSFRVRDSFFPMRTPLPSLLPQSNKRATSGAFRTGAGYTSCHGGHNPAIGLRNTGNQITFRDSIT